MLIKTGAENNGKLDSQYNVSNTANDFAVAEAEPTGRLNSKRMIISWNSSQYGPQNDNLLCTDVWGVIQEEVRNGWFVPSKSEWQLLEQDLILQLAIIQANLGLAIITGLLHNTSVGYTV